MQTQMSEKQLYLNPCFEEMAMKPYKAVEGAADMSFFLLLMSSTKRKNRHWKNRHLGMLRQPDTLFSGFIFREGPILSAYWYGKGLSGVLVLMFQLKDFDTGRVSSGNLAHCPSDSDVQ